MYQNANQGEKRYKMHYLTPERAKKWENSIDKIVEKIKLVSKDEREGELVHILTVILKSSYYHPTGLSYSTTCSELKEVMNILKLVNSQFDPHHDLSPEEQEKYWRDK